MVLTVNADINICPFPAVTLLITLPSENDGGLSYEGCSSEYIKVKIVLELNSKLDSVHLINTRHKIFGLEPVVATTASLYKPPAEGSSYIVIT